MKRKIIIIGIGLFSFIFKLYPSYGQTIIDSLECDSIYSYKYFNKHLDHFWTEIEIFVNSESNQYMETGDICHLLKIFALKPNEETYAMFIGKLMDRIHLKEEYKKQEYQIRLFFLSLISSPYTYIEHKRRNAIMNQIGKEKIYKYANQNEILKKYLDIVENDKFSLLSKYSQILILFNDFCLIYKVKNE
ncbi:MAG: hypothetical protein H6Q25_1211 [Bacteroidetes bacterium]|nr:hypothetical protein [Bacteroidota bacterium]